MNLNTDLRVSGSSRAVPETAANALPIQTEQIASESGIGAAVSTGRRQEEAGRSVR